ncbi:MAG: winged helix-turn-helix domain-containing protein [Hyphomonadaceae bacterium]|nr:winged helix-turn-helix domain-containing protein [Hyphomonadaceae bacterium]
MAAGLYEFGGFRLDAQRRQLLSAAGEPVALTPKAFEALLYLVERQGQLLEKRELLAALWPGLTVEENNLNQCISALRRALGEQPGEHRFIVTTPGRGYRFVADVITPGAAPLSPPAATAPKPTQRASVAVLPFANLTGDAGKDYFSDGMAEELICTLARTPGLKVPARTSSFAYKGKDADIRRIAADLGVEAVLEGSVRSAGERIRVTAQLIDADSGFHLWSQNYDRKFEDLFALQDELAGAIAGALRVHLAPKAHPTRDLEAYQLYMRGQALGSRNDWTANRLLDEAIARDPNFARAYAAKVNVLFFWQSLDFRQQLADEINATAKRALELDPGLAAVKGITGAVHAMHARWIEAEECFQSACALDPDEPIPFQGYALGQACAVGRYQAGLESARRAFALAPATMAISLSVVGCLQFAGHDEESLRYMDIAIELGHRPDAPPLPIMRSQAWRRAGRIEEARDEIRKVFSADMRAAGVDDAITLTYAAFADPANRDAAVDALRGLQRNPALADRFATWPWSIMILHWFAMLGALDDAYAIFDGILCEFERTGILNVVGHLPSLWMPEMRQFRRDERFQDVCRRLNFFPYWRKYGPPDGHTIEGDRLIAP